MKPLWEVRRLGGPSPVLSQPRLVVHYQLAASVHALPLMHCLEVSFSPHEGAVIVDPGHAKVASANARETSQSQDRPLAQQRGEKEKKMRHCLYKCPTTWATPSLC